VGYCVWGLVWVCLGWFVSDWIALIVAKVIGSMSDPIVIPS
jgi:membrane protein DedA with SNARE-associated domain